MRIMCGHVRAGAASNAEGRPGNYHFHWGHSLRQGLCQIRDAGLPKICPACPWPEPGQGISTTGMCSYSESLPHLNLLNFH